MSGHSDRNPYVGPRPIQQGEPIYGRSKEIHELYNKLQARRIVVLHSPSGAGKSSLVQAGLIPRLHEGKFDVWKPIRVNLDPTGLGVDEGVNRYLLSAMSSLEEELPAERRRSPAELAKLDFRTYLATRPRRKRLDGRSVVLIFDQFEEILTVAPRAIEAKREFFSTVGEALDKDNYWALFAIREDYLPALAPYRDRIPTQMSVTFRLDFLGLDGAREAAEQPAIDGGRTFPAVDQLIRDLSSIQVQQPNGSFVTEQGLYVEPVQLQVVCHRLWESLPDEDLVIDEEHIARYARVSESLGDYYAQAVRKAADGDPARERAIREWVGTKLIVEGNRSQVRQESHHSAGLDNELIFKLLGSYLVRSEHRAGANWFELSHDRLVEPVRHDNEAWEREHLHTIQVQAKLWEQGRRAPSLLLSAEALAGAREWARRNAALMTAGEQEFLEQSRELRKRERRSRRRLIALASVTASAAVLMGVLLRWALVMRNVALEAEMMAMAQADNLKSARDNLIEQQRALEAQTAKDLAETPGKRIRSLTLALNTYAEADADTAPNLAAIVEDGLFTATSWLHDVHELPGHADNIVDLAFSGDGTRLVSASLDHTAMLWDTGTARARRASLGGHANGVIAVELAAAGDRVLTRSADGVAALWSIAADHEAPAFASLDVGCAVSSARFAPDDREIVLGCRDGQLCEWPDSAARPTCVRVGELPGVAVTAIAFVEHGTLALAAHGNIVSVVDRTQARETARLLGHEASITSLDVSREGVIATASHDGTVKLWHASESSPRASLAAEQGELSHVEFSPDGEQLLSLGDSTTALVWRREGPATSHRFARVALIGHDAGIADGSFSPDGTQVATVSFDQTLRLWDPASGRLRASLEAPHGLISVAFTPDGKRIATGDLAGSGPTMVRVWDVEGEVAKQRVAAAKQLDVDVVALSPDGSHVAMADATHVRVWATLTGALVHELPCDGATRLQFSAHARELAARTRDGWTLWDVATGAEYETQLPDYVMAIAFSHDGAQLAFADWSGTVGRWQPYADERAGNAEPSAMRAEPERADDPPIAMLEFSPTGLLAGARIKGNVAVWDASGTALLDYAGEPTVLINAIRFSPSGKRLAVATKQKCVWVFDVEHGTLTRLDSELSDVAAVAFAPDERHLVSSSGALLELWDLELGKRVTQLGRHPDDVRGLAYADDGASVLAASRDGVVIEWIATAAQRHELACEVVRHSPVAYADALDVCMRTSNGS